MPGINQLRARYLFISLSMLLQLLLQHCYAGTNQLLRQLALLILISIAAVPRAWAQSGDATLRVVVITEEEGTPVIGANVIVTGPQGDTLHTGATDIYGFLEFSDVAPDTYGIRISYIGLQTHRGTVTLEDDETRIYRAALARTTAELGEVVVGVSRGAVNREAGMQTITVRDISRMPTLGSGGDLTMYLQTLPSVVVGGDRGGELYIRGGTPSQNLVLVDNMPVVKPFHISSLFSAFPQETISSVDLYAGGFGSKYTGATSSVLDVSLRQSNMRQFSGQASASPYMITLRAEGPLTVDRHSLMFMGRYSAIEETGPTLTGRDVPLQFSDMLARYSINWSGFTCNITGLQTLDRGRINPDRDVVLDWTNTTVGLRCLGYAEELENTIDFTIGYSGYQSTETGIDNTTRESGIGMGYLRLDNEGELMGLPMDYGFRLDFTRYKAELDERFADIRGEGVRFADLGSSLNLLMTTLSLYSSVEWQPSEDVTVIPGLASQARISDMQLTFEPRLRISWHPDGSDRQEVNFAAGRYFQMMEGITDERDAGTVFYVYKPIDEDDPLPESLHAILGYRREFGRNFAASLEGYGKTYKNFPVAQWTREPGNTVRTALAEGLTYGADLQLEFTLRPFYLSLGYGWSEVIYEAATEDLAAWLDEPVFRYNPSHDRRHQLNITSSYEFAGFTARLNWRYSSGAPYTRIFAYDLALNIPNQDPLQNQGQAQTLYSTPFDGRLPSFHRLDVSLGRTFDLAPKVTLDVDAGAVNAYNITNVFYFDVNTLQQVNELPLLPYVSVSTRFN